MGVNTNGRNAAGGHHDPRFKRILWYLICSTKGGANRARLLQLINQRPSNANQISLDLQLDYKTVIHHLKVLQENGLILTDQEKSYGAVYFLTPLMDRNYEILKEILVKIGKK